MKKEIQRQVFRIKDVILITGLSRSTIYEKQDPSSQRFDPDFPPKIKLGARAVGWLQSDISHWIDSMKIKSIEEGASL